MGGKHESSIVEGTRAIDKMRRETPTARQMEQKIFNMERQANVFQEEGVYEERLNKLEKEIDDLRKKHKEEYPSRAQEPDDDMFLDDANKLREKRLAKDTEEAWEGANASVPPPVNMLGEERRRRPAPPPLVAEGGDKNFGTRRGGGKRKSKRKKRKSKRKSKTKRRRRRSH